MHYVSRNISGLLNIRRNLVWLFVLPMSLGYGQSTPKELGRLVFDCVKIQSINCMNTYLPTLEEYKHIIKTVYRHSIKSDSEIVSNHTTDVNVFNTLLQQIYTDSMQMKLDWKKARLKRVETNNFLIKIDSNYADHSNRVTITEVKIIFTVDTLDYILFLPSIWKYKHKWKLGNQILYGNADFEYGAEFTF